MPNDWEPMLLAPATPAVAHLDDQALLRPLRPQEHKHLSDCGWCQERHRIVLSRHDAADGTDDEFEQALAEGDWVESFRGVAAQAVLPSRVRDLMTAGPGAEPVNPGQLWRLTWKGHHLLVVVIAIDAWHVLVAPVTTDAALADEVTLLVAADDSPIGTDLAVWVRQRAAVPLFTLDRHLGVLPAVGDEQLAPAHVLNALVHAHRAGSPSPAGIPTGRRLAGDDADAVAMADALAEQTAWFADATAGLRYLPAEDEHEEAASATARPSVAELIAGLPMGLGELTERTGLPPGRLLDLRRGAQASDAEYRAVADAAGLSIDCGAPVDAGAFSAAMTEVSSPHRRAARRAWIRQHAPDGDPDDPTELVHSVLHQPLAARTVTGQQHRDDEQERLRVFWRDRVALALADFT